MSTFPKDTETRRKEKLQQYREEMSQNGNGRGVKKGVSPLYRVTTVLFCLTTIVSITLCFLIYGYYQIQGMEDGGKEEVVEAVNIDAGVAVYEQAEVDELVQEAIAQATLDTETGILADLKENLANGDGTLATLRAFYPDDIVMTYGKNYLFIPINKDLKMNPYSIHNVAVNEDLSIDYFEDGQMISRKGIDVSKYQGGIDWNAVAGDGVGYAFIRLGIRGYGEGTLVVDETFENNIQGALGNGLDVGVYFFTQAISNEEALEEAQFVIDNLKDYPINYPVVLDVEAVDSDSARTNQLTQAERTEYAITFCEAVKAAGYTPMIYGNLRTFMLMLDMAQLEEYEKWFAAYDTTQMYFPYDYSIWQYTDKGSVDGITGDVDLNISFGKW